MTIIEAGVIGGGAAGGLVGGIICKSQPLLGITAGAVAGVALGAAAGWVYSMIVIWLMATAGVLWRVARGHTDMTPTEPEMARMTPIATAGTLLGIFAALVSWIFGGWPHALAAAVAVAIGVAIITSLAARRHTTIV